MDAKSRHLDISQRWRTLAAAIMLGSVSGLFYCFSLYSDTLKRKFKLDQGDLDWIGTISFWMATMAVYIGYIVQRCGPRMACSLAVLFGVVGWGGTAAALALEGEWNVPYWLLIFLAICQGQGQTATDCSAVPMIATNFPECRGQAIGIYKAFVGLSGSLAASTYLGLFAPRAPPHHPPTRQEEIATDAAVQRFLVYITCLWLVATLIGVCFLRPAKPGVPPLHPDAPTARRVLPLALVSVGLLTALLVASAVQPLLSLPHSVAPALSAAVFTALLLTSGAIGLVREVVVDERAVLVSDTTCGAAVLAADPPQLSSFCPQGMPVAAGSTSAALPLLAATTSSAPLVVSGGGCGDSCGDRGHGSGITDARVGDACVVEARDVTVLLALRSLDFWLLTLGLMFCGGGSGLFLINNLAQISISRGEPSEAVAAMMVGLLSAANCIGRLSSGMLSDYLLRRHATPRPLLLVGWMGVMAVAFGLLLLPTSSPAVLMCACLLGGSAYGAHAGLAPVIASELFGLTHLATIYMAINLGLGVGSYMFGTWLAATVYSAASQQHGLAPGEPCTHRDCFSVGYRVCASFALLAAFLCLVLAWRSAPLYRALKRGAIGACQVHSTSTVRSVNGP